MARVPIENLKDRDGNSIQFKDKEMREQVEEFQATASTAVATANQAVEIATGAAEYVAGVETRVESAAGAAAGSAQSAEQSRVAAETAAGNAESAKTAAAGSAAEAASSASEAEAVRDTVLGYSRDAAASAQAASTAYQNALDQAERAADQADDAANSAGDAAESAADSATSAQNSEASRQRAQGHAEDAATEAANAARSAEAASGSATAAAGSASDAAESARTLTVDTTLSEAGRAADAKAAGDAVAELKNDLDNTNSAFDEVVKFFNWLDYPETVIPNTNINTTTGAKSTNSAFTLYVMPYNGETLYINQCSDNLKKVILCSDANADNVLGFANDDGFSSWNSYYTSTITGATYIAIAVKSNYYDTALVIEKDNYPLWSDYKRKITEDTYIKPLAELTDEVDIVEAQIETSKNLFDFTTISDWGSWCNYINGTIQSNSSVATYAYSEYIEVEPSTAYATQHGNRGVSFFDANKVFISGTNTSTFTTPANCKYAIINISRGDPDYPYTMLLKRETAIQNSEPFIPYFYGFDKPKRGYITCGINGDYPTIKQGFEVAIARNCDCVIMPGTYDLVQEGISGKGYILPNRVYGYGATLVCRLAEEDWNLSPLNVSVYSEGAEVYGLEVICANCRYCIHDDMGAMVKQSYHNVFKDLHLVHESAISEVLLAPQCIGGGFGKEGMVEIDSCIFEATIRDVSYHSASGGTQRKGCTLRCRDSVFSNTFTSTNVGSDTSFMNTSYICGCKMATLPNTTPTANTQIIEWNNVVPA